MSQSAIPPGWQRRQDLIARLGDIQVEIDEVRDILPSVNDAALRPRIEELLAVAGKLVALHGSVPGADIAEALAGLQSATRTLRVPPTDPELGATPTLRSLRAAQGRLRSAVDDAMDAVRAMHLPVRPGSSQPEPTERLPIPAMLQRLANAEKKLDALDARRGEATVHLQQRGLLNVYVDTMRLELLLARLHLKIDADSFDIGALLRAAESMTELTGDFLATLQAWSRRQSNRIGAGVVSAAEAMGGAVRSVGSGARTLAGLVMRRARRAERAADPFEPEMVLIPPGTFVMGTSEEEDAREGVPEDIRPWSKPQHEVTISRGFLLAKYPVTRGEFAAFVADSGYQGAGEGWRDPGFPQTDRDPVVNVSAIDAEAYARWLSLRTGRAYRLPSEAEWEYAARAGTTTARFWGDGWDGAAAYLRTEGHGTYPLGGHAPNGFGLHDMLGNVLEWLADHWHDDYRRAPADGSAWTTGGDAALRVLRGGSWISLPRLARAGCRLRYHSDNRNNDVGFRLSRTL